MWNVTTNHTSSSKPISSMDTSAYHQLRARFAERSEVVLAYLFGSQVRGHIGPCSDYDFGVMVDQDGETAPSELQAHLAHEMASVVGTKSIDVVLLNRASVELAYHVIAQGQILYRRSHSAQVEYEAYVLGRYGDYLPVLRRQRQQIIEDTAHAHRVQRYRTALGRTERTLSALAAPARENA